MTQETRRTSTKAYVPFLIKRLPPGPQTALTVTHNISPICLNSHSLLRGLPRALRGEHGLIEEFSPQQEDFLQRAVENKLRYQEGTYPVVSRYKQNMYTQIQCLDQSINIPWCQCNGIWGCTFSALLQFSLALRVCFCTLNPRARCTIRASKPHRAAVHCSEQNKTGTWLVHARKRESYG